MKNKILLAAMVMALAGSLSPSARAETGSATCMVKVISALPHAGGIDPGITVLRPYLVNPPFNSWKTFKLLSEKEAELRPGSSATYPLPNGNDAVVTYTEHKTNTKAHSVRGVFAIKHAKSDSRTAFTLDEGKFFVVAGEKFGGGILIYSLSCKTQD